MRTISKAEFDALNSANWAEIERAIKTAKGPIAIRVCGNSIKAIRVYAWLTANRPQYRYRIEKCDSDSDGFRIMAERKVK